MPKKFDVDEDGFPIYRPSPELIAEAEARTNSLVDCKGLAKERMNALPAPNPNVYDELAQLYGIDGTKTLTEVEGNDFGDAYDVADEPLVHALRYIPVARWTPYDVRLMLAYGHGRPIALALAERFLEDDPMLEAEHFPGDLLLIFSSMVSESSKRDLVRQLIARAEAQIWARFDDAASQAGLTSAQTRGQRLRLHRGIRSEPGRNPFLRVEQDLGTLAELKDTMDPPAILERAQAKQLFARYRPRKSVELVPLTDFDVAEYRAKIDDPETFQFRRSTVFQIAHDGGSDGVRLRIVAEAAINHIRGVWFEDVAAAKASALRDYGITSDDWTDVRPKSEAS